jgi:putative transposase
MPDSKTLSHTTWDCKYHVVFTPKYRRQALYMELRQYLGELFHALAAQRECRIDLELAGFPSAPKLPL